MSIGVTKRLLIASPLRPLIFQHDGLVSGSLVAHPGRWRAVLAKAPGTRFPFFLTSQEHLPYSSNLFASSGNPQVDYVNALLFVCGSSLFKTFGCLCG